MAKHIRVRNNQSGEMVEILVKDFSGRTIDRYKFSGSDKRFFGSTIESLYIKFGFQPLINLKESVIINSSKQKGFFDAF